MLGLGRGDLLLLLQKEGTRGTNTGEGDTAASGAESLRSELSGATKEVR